MASMIQECWQSRCSCSDGGRNVYQRCDLPPNPPCRSITPQSQITQRAPARKDHKCASKGEL